ncbi:hypothetical protein L6452_30956 [Arctium lappa]|uniref:Uncharacterized protein n=1 Tax=Arctium lappa TaxID=4217 RepID=A0ACB8ZJR3_ARCLA|nr:hypothetical protein L6452_30956 [Arctium lappa]
MSSEVVIFNSQDHYPDLAYFRPNITLLEESLKYQVIVNEIISIECEQAIAALKAKKATVEGWSTSSTKITKIIRAQIPANDKAGLGYHPEKDESNRDCSMLKFGILVSSIPDTSSTHCSSSCNSIPKDLSKSSKLGDKGKYISHPQKATKKAKLKVLSIPSVSQYSSSGTKITDISQRSSPKLKIDIKPKKSEELKVPPRYYDKGILGAGPAHLKFSNSTAHSHKANFVYRKCYHCGLTDHITSKCPTATKAEKTTKVKMIASKAKKVTKAEKSVEVKNATKVIQITKVKVTTEAESSNVVKIAEPSITTNIAGPIEKWAFSDFNWLWHERLSHLNFKTLNSLYSMELVSGHPQHSYAKESLCSAYEKGKHTKASFKSKQVSSVASPLPLLHIDLFGPVNIQSIVGNKYTLGIIDEYSRYTWVIFFAVKVTLQKN